MRTERQFRERLTTIKATAQAFLVAADEQAAYVASRAPTLVNEWTRQPENRAVRVDELQFKAEAKARSEFRATRQTAAGELRTLHDEFKRDVDAERQAARRITVSAPAVTEDERLRFTGADATKVLESRELRRDLQHLRVVLEFRDLSLDAQLDALERAQRSGDVIAGAYLDERLERALPADATAHERASTAKARDRWEALRTARVPAGVDAMLTAVQTELEQATVVALQRAAAVAIEDQPTSTAAVSALFDATRARRATEAPAGSAV